MAFTVIDIFTIHFFRLFVFLPIPFHLTFSTSFFFFILLSFSAFRFAAYIYAYLSVGVCCCCACCRFFFFSFVFFSFAWICICTVNEFNCEPWIGDLNCLQKKLIFYILYIYKQSKPLDGCYTHTIGWIHSIEYSFDFFFFFSGIQFVLLLYLVVYQMTFVTVKIVNNNFDCLPVWTF